MGERHDQARMQPVRFEALLDRAVELALDHHADKAGAEADAPAALRCWALALIPVERPRQAALGPVDLPGHLDDAGPGRPATLLAGVGREGVPRHAPTLGGGRSGG